MTNGKYTPEEIEINNRAFEKDFDDIDQRLNIDKIDIENILDNSEPNFEDLKNKIGTYQNDIYQNLCSKCKKYITKCINESKHTVILRLILPRIILIYFVIYNMIFFCIMPNFEKNPELSFNMQFNNIFILLDKIDYFKNNGELFWGILASNCLILIIPLVYFFKAYGERYKNNHFTPTIKTAIDTALRRIDDDTSLGRIDDELYDQE